MNCYRTVNKNSVQTTMKLHHNMKTMLPFSVGCSASIATILILLFSAVQKTQSCQYHTPRPSNCKMKYWAYHIECHAFAPIVLTSEADSFISFPCISNPSILQILPVQPSRPINQRRRIWFQNFDMNEEQ